MDRARVSPCSPRGDGPRLFDAYLSSLRCSPHARGWFPQTEWEKKELGLFPVCVGVVFALPGVISFIF